MSHQNSGPRDYVHKDFHNEVVAELGGNLAAALADNERISGLLSVEVKRVAELEGELRVETTALMTAGSEVRELQAQLDMMSSEAKRLARGWTEDEGKLEELQAQLDRAKGELSDEKFLHQRACAALLRLNMQLGADALGEEVGESIIEDCNADREKWARMSVDRFGPSGNPQADRATEPRADANARETWAELQRLRRVLLSFGRDHLSTETFYGPESVLSEAWQELGRLRNRDRTLGRIAAALGMEYVSDNAISDNRDLRVYRAVMELKERTTEPRPMSEAPQWRLHKGETKVCDASDIPHGIVDDSSESFSRVREIAEEMGIFDATHFSIGVAVDGSLVGALAFARFEPLYPSPTGPDQMRCTWLGCNVDGDFASQWDLMPATTSSGGEGETTTTDGQVGE